ncbi:PLDc N-terminal domain-containing protein [Gramella sp. GC03-9]|uniref:PLDc N-terminal domain-containing protein n=1 Tax=Christiangramia oceanisediminis TaxID=2920386 RepID=A0A9X2RA69_9FLAO|nr:PLDc N-terminal domain-containing protein [Gramella oceanisediminis]MCP9201188.1 PLDc N-terminal domain-containing protein [Gramella oceanisediminis]
MDNLMMSFIVFLVFLGIAFVIWVIIDLFQKDFSMTEKLLWLIVILIAPLLGSIVYFIFGRNRRESA